MTKLNWSTFTKKIHISAPINQLYKAWTTEEGLSSWFLSAAEFRRNGHRIAGSDQITKGDLYTWFWHNWDGQENGTIMDLKENEYVKFSFANVCEVLITLEQKEDAVLLSLTQSNIPLDEKSKFEIFYGCSNGWTFWLANLKAFLEHGVLLNETKIDLRGFDSAGYEFVNM